MVEAEVVTTTKKVTRFASLTMDSILEMVVHMSTTITGSVDTNISAPPALRRLETSRITSLTIANLVLTNVTRATKAAVTTSG